MKYVHTNIISRDWKKLVVFYENVFDCKIVPPVRKQSGKWLENGTGVHEASLEGAHLRLPGYGDEGPTLEIYTYSKVIDQANMMPNQRGLGHLAFEVEDVSEIVQLVLAHGGSTSGQITCRSIDQVGVITFVYVRDPEGNLIEIQNWERVS